MMSYTRYLRGLLLVLLVTLSACGQRPDDPVTTGAEGEIIDTESAVEFGANGEVLNGADPELGAALASALTVHVISDTNTLATGGVEVANIQVLVTDESNRAAPGEAVEFSSTAGILQDIVDVTDVNGVASAVLNLGRDFANRNIVVTAVAGATVGSVQIAADGSSIDISGQDLLVNGASAAILVTMTDGTGGPIANEEVNFVSIAGNTITPPQGMTDINGQLEIEVGSDSGSDTITVTALDGTVTNTFDITVANDTLEFVSLLEGQEIGVGTITTVTARWLSEGAPVAGENLRFSLTAGQILGSSIDTTNANGEASVLILSGSAGPATLTVEAEATGDPALQTNIEFVATTPSQLNISASSTRIPTGDNSIITALITDVSGNPVKNSEVLFTSADLRGGQLNPATAVTNSDGVATVTFTAGALATEFEAIDVVAQVVNTTIADSVRLSVVERVLNVTIGTTDLIRAINGETQYSLPFVVQVADGSGIPLESASVELSVRPLSYSKGFFELVNENGLTLLEHVAAQTGISFNPDRWAQRQFIECVAEDLNGNRFLDVGEDVNNNGSLDPQDPAVVAADSVNEPTLVGGTITTDATGSGFFAVIYPQSNSLWAAIEVTARARALGAEADASFITGLPIELSELEDVASGLPNQISPYGIDLDCSNEL